MALSQSAYLAAMGIQSWHLKQPKVSSGPSSTEDLNTFGTGNSQADLLLIGDAPDFYENQAGQLLNGMLYAIGLDRQSIYSTTLLNCRLPDNRSPSQEEISQGIEFLDKQIALVQPKVLLVFGSVAAQHLLNTQAPFGQPRGKLYTYGAIPLIATYHPAHLLVNPQDKSKAWQDLQVASRILNLPPLPDLPPEGEGKF